jgi:hypothetical protein
MGFKRGRFEMNHYSINPKNRLFVVVAKNVAAVSRTQ